MEEPGRASCAFCGRSDPDDDVRVQERLGVQVAVCAGCRERFAGATAPPAPVRPVVEEPRGLPPTLGQQSSAVLQLVRRMARIAAERPYTEVDCPHCGHPVHEYPGAAGDRVGLAKESVLAASVPVEERWRVVDGVAVPADGEHGEDEDSVGARVRHDVVCPANPVPANPRLSRMWHAHLQPPPAEF